MALASTWEKLRYFKQSENWGDIDAISDELLLRLDDFRHYINSSVFILAGVSDSGHTEKSYHYKENGACAVDIIMPNYSGNPIDLILSANRFGFTGIGWYPHWEYGGKKVGGLHLDLRPLKLDDDGTINYRHNRWMGIDGESGQEYIPLTFENILKYGGNLCLN